MASASVRNYSRPLQQSPSEPVPDRPLRSPLRFDSPPLPFGDDLPTPRRRTRSSGPASPRPDMDLSVLQPPAPRQRTLSTGAAPEFTSRHDGPRPFHARERSWDHPEPDSGRSSPSSPTTFIAPSEFVARGPGPRDSVLTTDSGVTASSAYPSTLSADSPESPNSPRIAAFNDMSFSTLDADDVSYRLDLLVRNHYFLPPAHSKPSVSELSLLGVETPKKSPLLKPLSPSFRDFFRKAKPQTAPQSPEAAPKPPVAAALSRVPTDPIPTHIAPPSTPRVPAPRIAVLRERLDDLQQAAQDVEREMRLGRRTPSGSARQLMPFEDVDPTDEVDLPEYLVPHDVPPRTPSPSAYSEDDKWRRGLLEQAVGLSFTSSPLGYAAAPSGPVPGPSSRSRREPSQRAAAHADTAPPSLTRTPRVSAEKRVRRPRSSSPHENDRKPSSDTQLPNGNHSFARPASRTASLRPSNASIRSQPSPSTLSPSAIIGSPIISPSETTSPSQFSTVRSRPPAPTPNRALLQETSPVSPPQSSRWHSPQESIDYEPVYRPETPPVAFTALSPAPPRKAPSIMSSGRSRGNSKASSIMELRRAQSTPVLKDVHEHIELGPPAFILQDPSGTRAPVTLPTMSTITSMTSGSHYSDDEEVADDGPPDNRWSRPSMDTHESIGQRPSLDMRVSFDHRPSLDGRPSLTISTGSRPGSPHSLYSSTFGERNSMQNSRRSGSTIGGPHAPVPDIPSHLTAPPVPAPRSAGPAFFDEVQDRFLSQESSSDTDSEADMDEEIIHLGTTSTSRLPPSRPGSRAASVNASPVVTHARMAWRPPVGHMAEATSPGGIDTSPGPPVAGRRPSESSQGHRGWQRKDKGLEMLQRAQAGSVVSLGTRSNRSLREELTERDVADRRLEGLLVQHMEEEKDRMKRIASGLAAAQQQQQHA
ncbi:hypothetical protein AURDEDRAFT_161895 [Auricularia subglabra TFB-10046 SS5]|nr:hypothetical protein AURDEDRAFT_161895 [Auricularia subglabra TFB-10046 SS5]